MTSVDGKSEQRPSSEKLVTVIFNSSTLISRRVGGGFEGFERTPFEDQYWRKKKHNEEVEQRHEVYHRESRMSALVLNAYQI